MTQQTPVLKSFVVNSLKFSATKKIADVRSIERENKHYLMTLHTQRGYKITVIFRNYPTIEAAISAGLEDSPRQTDPVVGIEVTRTALAVPLRKRKAVWLDLESYYFALDQAEPVPTAESNEPMVPLTLDAKAA